MYVENPTTTVWGTLVSQHSNHLHRCAPLLWSLWLVVPTSAEVQYFQSIQQFLHHQKPKKTKNVTLIIFWNKPKKSQLTRLRLQTLLHREQSVRSSLKKNNNNNNKNLDNKYMLSLLHNHCCETWICFNKLASNYRACAHLCLTCNRKRKVRFKKLEKVDLYQSKEWWIYLARKAHRRGCRYCH